MAIKIIVPGVFDYFHNGHKRLIDYALELGEVIVVVNGDDVTTRAEQSEVARELQVFDYLNGKGEVVITHTNALDIALKHTPCIWLTGNDWDIEKTSNVNNVLPEFWEQHGIMLLYKDRTPHVSSTSIRNRPHRSLSSTTEGEGLAVSVEEGCGHSELTESEVSTGMWDATRRIP